MTTARRFFPIEVDEDAAELRRRIGAAERLAADRAEYVGAVNLECARLRDEIAAERLRNHDLARQVEALRRAELTLRAEIADLRRRGPAKKAGGFTMGTSIKRRAPLPRGEVRRVELRSGYVGASQLVSDE